MEISRIIYDILPMSVINVLLVNVYVFIQPEWLIKKFYKIVWFFFKESHIEFMNLRIKDWNVYFS